MNAEVAATDHIVDLIKTMPAESSSPTKQTFKCIKQVCTKDIHPTTFLYSFNPSMMVCFTSNYCPRWRKMDVEYPFKCARNSTVH
jgi:hypothetical protein